MNATRVSVRSFSGFCLFALALFLASCGGGGGGGGGDVPTNTVLFQVIDHNGVGVSGVDVYLDGGAAPIGSTDATGSMPFNLTGVHSVDFHKAGYRVNSRVNQDWTAVSGTVSIGATPYPDVATTGTVSGTIFNTVNGDLTLRVQLRRSSDGFASRSFPFATEPSTTYSLSAASGTSELFVFPNMISSPASSSYIGYSPGVAVPSAGVNPTLVRGTATSFAVTGTGGFPAPGSINASYGAQTNRFLIGSGIITLGTASTSGATLPATTVNVPPLNLVYPDASYSLVVSAFSVASTFGIGTITDANFQVRNETRIFPTYAAMVAAATTQDIVLTNDSLVAISPAHNATNVPVSPTFTWSRVGSPDFVEVRIFEYDPVRQDYAKEVWYARVYGDTFSVTPPATVTLNPNSFYSYEIYARRDLFDGAGTFVSRQRNGWVDVKFSTGATTPP